MSDQIDLLQIKIENAKKQLSEDALDAIAAVPWQAEIIKMRETKGYSFEQLGNLEMETELVLCGLLNPKDYPEEIENRMRITKAQANELVNEMNSLIFAKIKEELIKITERKKIFAKKTTGEENNVQAFKEHGIEIIPEKLELNSPLEEYPDLGRGEVDKFRDTSTPSSKLATPQEGNQIQEEKLELKGNVLHPISAQKLSGSVQIPTVKTDHSLKNLQPSPTQQSKPAIDPYREIPE